MNDEIKIGDLVILRSGSPNMTVTSVTTILGDPFVFVCWFEGHKQFDGRYPPAALKKIPDPDV